MPRVSQPKVDPLSKLVAETISIQKQALIFVNAKRSAESVAEDLAKQYPAENKELANKILKALSAPTSQCKRLAFCVEHGMAFHHAGLVAKQRHLVEEAFVAGKLKVICATTTLCLSPRTKIWSGMSEVPVSELRNSDKLNVLCGTEFRKQFPQKIIKNSNYVDLVKISSVAGYEIRVTFNHEMLIKRNGGKILLPAAEVKKGDRIATIGKIVLEDYAHPEIKDFVKENIAPINFLMDENTLYMIGAFLGDGCSGAETKEGKIIYKSDPSIIGIDREIFENVQKTCDKLKITYKEKKNHDNIPVLRLSKVKWLREFLVRCGVEKGARKRVHQTILCMAEKQVAGLLQGLFDTDGHVEKRGAIGFTNISLVLIKQVQKLLLRFSIVSRVRERKGKVVQIKNKKKCHSKPYFELLISQNKSILLFYKDVGFRLRRKQHELKKIVTRIRKNILSVSCEYCSYTLHENMFSGRTKAQLIWAKQKEETIIQLGLHEELGLRQLTQILGYSPRKNDERLNHHYTLIEKRKIGSKSKTEWFWSLNSIGKWVFSQLVDGNKNFATLQDCPECGSTLTKIQRENWRSNDFEGEIFWDIVRKKEDVSCEQQVFDVVLPENGMHDHLFVAEGFVVHNSAGVNTPAFRVIIRDLHRFDGYMQEIPVLDYIQMRGRAGRPDFHDTYGEAITIAKNPADVAWIQERYWDGEPEPIYSKLASLPALRSAVLSLYASRFVNSHDELITFFSKTFYAHQYGNIKKLADILTEVESQLEAWGFIHSSIATPIGRRVAQLYIDPYSAQLLIAAILSSKPKSDASIINAICNCIEMRPLLRLKTSDFADPNQVVETLLEEPSMFSVEYEDFLSAAKTTGMLMLWCDESTEEFIFQEFGVRPGELKVKIDTSDWLLYSATELCKLLNVERRDFFRARLRIKYGVKAELMSLLRIKGIGRVRARKLFNAGLTTIAAIAAAPQKQLEVLLGVQTAAKVREQVSQPARKI